MIKAKHLVFPFIASLFLSCGDDPIPKPKGYLRLEYPKPKYVEVDISLPFTFEKNKLSSKVRNVKVDPINNIYGINIDYPTLKGSIYLTYIKVTEDNLIPLIKDAQNLTQEHTIKADEIAQNLYENPTHKVYGMFYEVGGNAASQSQFYVTDSINHFLNGSLYFNSKPNFDSIYPASDYLKNDIKRFMETLSWKE